MRLPTDFAWGLAGAAATGVAIAALWPSAPPGRRAVSGPPAPVVAASRPGRLGAPLPSGRAAGRPTAVPAGEVERIRTILARDPADIDAHLDLARVHLARREMRSVWDETRYVLARSPGEPRALTYQALVRFAAGDKERAVLMLEQVVAAAPNLEEARRALAFVHARTGRPVAGVPRDSAMADR
jgi:hypothetical protein